MTIPGLGRGMAWSWRRVTDFLWRCYARRWREDAQYYAYLAGQGARQKSYQVLANTLSEMADVQKAIVAQLNERQQAQSSVHDQHGHWLTIEQATTMLDKLQYAQQALRVGEEEAS